jgi:eukaryotic-like serine/threonine-protein kinase
MKAPSSIEYLIGQPMPGTKWVVRGKLGQGGMGIVLDVVKEQLIRGAMKVLLPPFAKQPEFAAKFFEEVKVTARLQHPNIVQVLDFDRLSDGTPFMVMERLRGRTLRAALRETRQRGKLWTAANTYAVAAQASEGLYRAHSHEPSIVHLDVKPENIFLHRTEASFDSVVKVMDFGVAAIVGEGDRQNIGTPRYMAPEQVAGGDVSPQTDQYALALVIYEMLTGRLPWDVNLRDSKALGEAHLYAAPTPPSHFCPWLPSRMDAALLKGLSKDPRARHDTLHGLMFELRGLQRIGDRPATGDANTTDPSVGTLAEGGALVREEDDTFERIVSPHAGPPQLAAAGPAGAFEVSMQFSESSEPPTWPRPERAGSLAKPPPLAAGPRVGSEAMTGAVRAEVSQEHGHVADQALDTPMTGESGPKLESHRPGKPSRGGAKRMALASVGVVALAAVLVSTRIHSREGRTVGVLPVATSTSGAVSTATDFGLGAPPPLSILEAARAPVALAETVVSPILGAHTEPGMTKAASARPDGGASGPGLSKATPAPRPAIRGPSAKASVPDDGRDELYVPAVTR